MDTNKDFESIFRHNYPAMFRLASMLLHDREAARDVVQDVFATVYSRDIDLRRDEAPGYLLTAVRNSCLNRIRSLDSETRLRNLYLLDNEMYASDSWPDEELLENLERALGQLNGTDRRIIELRFHDRSTFRQMGRILGISDVAAFKALNRAINRIRIKMRNDGKN